MKSPLVATLLWLALCLCAQAQPQCPVTPATGTSNTMCASTAFVAGSVKNAVKGPGASIVGDLVVWNNTTGTLVADGGLPPPKPLSGNVTYYVRTDGNNSTCTGLVNASAASAPACAWATLQYATSYICNNINLAGFRATIQLGIAGTYDGHSLCNYSGTYTAGVTSPIIVGDTANQSNYIISSSSVNGVLAVGVSTPWTYQGVKLTTTGGANNCFEADINSLLYLDQVTIGACGNTSISLGYHGQVEVISYNSDGLGTKLTITGGSNIFISGNYNSGFLIQPGNTIVCTGTPAFIDFMQLNFGMLANFDGTTFSGCGGVTGTKWEIDPTSAASFNGQTSASLNGLPGNVNGSFTPQPVERGGTGLSSGVISGTKTVRASGGASDCTLIFTNGSLTGGTC